MVSWLHGTGPVATQKSAASCSVEALDEHLINPRIQILCIKQDESLEAEGIQPTGAMVQPLSFPTESAIASSVLEAPRQRCQAKRLGVFHSLKTSTSARDGEGLLRW